MIPVFWVIGGVAVGVLAGVAAWQRKRLKALTDDTIKALPPEFRLPKPDFAMMLPQAPEDYEYLDGVICDCIGESTSTSPEDLVLEVQRCAAGKLYKDFPWPPITGDNPSASTLWTILGYQASRNIATNVCPTKAQLGMPISRSRRPLLRLRSTRR